MPPDRGEGRRTRPPYTRRHVRPRDPGLDPRHDRRHAARPAQPHRRRPDAAARRQARGVQPRRLDQGPDRGQPDRRRRARRQPPRRRDDRRADLRQHRHRPRDRRPAEGLPRHRGHARQDVAREDRPAARAGRGGRDRADRRRPRVPAVLLPRRRPPDRGDPRRLPAQPVPQPGQPADPLRHHRPGDLAPDRGPDHPPRRRRRHRRDDHRRRPLPQGAEPGRRDHRRRPRGLDLLRRGGAPVPGRGRRRGLLADHLRPERRRPLRPRLRSRQLPHHAPARRDRGDARRRLVRARRPRGARGRRGDRRPGRAHRRDPPRRRPRLPQQDLQRHLDGLARDARADERPQRRRRPARQAGRGRDPAARRRRVAPAGQGRRRAAARAPGQPAPGRLPHRPGHDGRLDRRARPAAPRGRQPRDHGHPDRRRDGAAVPRRRGDRPGPRGRRAAVRRPPGAARDRARPVPTGILTRADLLEALVS